MSYASFIEHVVLPAGDLLLGTNLVSKVQEFRQSQWYTRDQLHDLQTRRLQALLAHAVRNVPFYRDVDFDERGDPTHEIKKFPVMDKPIIQANLERLVVGRPNQLIRVSSSGSSGVQGSVYCSKHELATIRAVLMLWLDWAGYRLGSPILQFGMTTRRGFVKSIKDRLTRTDYYPAYDLESGVLLKKLQALRRKKGSAGYVMGYASSLYLLAKAAEEHDIGDVRFESAVSWGDKLFPHYRSLIETRFQTKVHDTYGCTEGCMIAGECEQSGLHITTPQVYIELHDDDGHDVSAAELGRVIVTRLDNYTMPLIRYNLGDLAGIEPPDVRCACGRQTPLLKKIIGRDTDIVKTRSGKQMIVHFFTGIFEHYPEVRQFRVIQRTLDGIDVEYIRGPGFTTAITERIRQQIVDQLHEHLQVSFVEVPEIAPTPSGKPRMVVSMLPDSPSPPGFRPEPPGTTG